MRDDSLRHSAAAVFAAPSSSSFAVWPRFFPLLLRVRERRNIPSEIRRARPGCRGICVSSEFVSRPALSVCRTGSSRCRRGLADRLTCPEREYERFHDGCHAALGCLVPLVLPVESKAPRYPLLRRLSNDCGEDKKSTAMANPPPRRTSFSSQAVHFPWRRPCSNQRGDISYGPFWHPEAAAVL